MVFFFLCPVRLGMLRFVCGHDVRSKLLGPFLEQPRKLLEIECIYDATMGLICRYHPLDNLQYQLC